MTGFDAGRVRLRLQMREDAVAAVDVACERPDVAAVLAGRSADEAVALVPLVYSLCGQAQGIAARAALAAARGTATAPHVDARVAAEALREHAWKLLVDWPRQLGQAADEALFVRVAKTAPGLGADIAAKVRAHRLLAGGNGGPGTGGIDALLAERMAARLDELTALLEGRPAAAGTVAAKPLEAGRGSATVATARGELVHEIALDGDRIAAYRIVAPTDRLFASDGPLPRLLLGHAGEGARQAAERAVMALDPCVPCEIAVA